MKNHAFIHAKEPYFQKNGKKFEEMLENIKNMKNIVHDFKDSDLVYKNNKMKPFLIVVLLQMKK